MEMSDKIKALRKANKLTLEELGDMVGVGKSTVRKWESGDIKNMRRDKIAKLANAFNVTPSYLMGWENDKGEVPLGAASIKPLVTQSVAGGFSFPVPHFLPHFEMNHPAPCPAGNLQPRRGSWRRRSRKPPAPRPSAAQKNFSKPLT